MILMTFSRSISSGETSLKGVHFLINNIFAWSCNISIAVMTALKEKHQLNPTVSHREGFFIAAKRQSRLDTVSRSHGTFMHLSAVLLSLSGRRLSRTVWNVQYVPAIEQWDLWTETGSGIDWGHPRLAASTVWFNLCSVRQFTRDFAWTDWDED